MLVHLLDSFRRWPFNTVGPESDFNEQSSLGRQVCPARCGSLATINNCCAAHWLHPGRSSPRRSVCRSVYRESLASIRVEMQPALQTFYAMQMNSSAFIVDDSWGEGQRWRIFRRNSNNCVTLRTLRDRSYKYYYD